MDRLLVRDLGLMDYSPVHQAMQKFTDQRNENTLDEIWFVQHSPVFTQGQAGKAEHILAAGDIPVVQTERGGQVTYHGPGQLVAYPMIDIKRSGIGVRELVSLIEDSIVECLGELDIESKADPEAPGVYVAGRKVASVGLRIRKGCSFHGLSINVNMDMQPFSRINPCGYQGLEMVQVKDFVPLIDIRQVQSILQKILLKKLNYRNFDIHSELPS